MHRRLAVTRLGSRGTTDRCAPAAAGRGHRPQDDPARGRLDRLGRAPGQRVLPRSGDRRARPQSRPAAATEWLAGPGGLSCCINHAATPSTDGMWSTLMYGGILNRATEPTPEVSLWVVMPTEAVLTLGLVSVILGTASGARNVGDQRRDRHRRLHRPGVGVGRAGVGCVDEPGPLARPRAGRVGPDQLLDLPGRTDHRRDGRGRLRVDSEGQGHHGQRRGSPSILDENPQGL